jgi:hypothetical protein
MAKSPVYGLGRNKTHRPRGSKNWPSAANVNMRGKKTKSMSCCCCECIDMRDKMMFTIHKQEMYNYGDESQ